MAKSKCNLAICMARKKMDLMSLHRATEIRYNTLRDLYHEIAISIKFEHIEKICDVLECTAADLIEYAPEKK